MRKPIVATGWKMYMNDIRSSRELLRELASCADKYPDIETFLFPAAMHMESASEILGDTSLSFGAQNISEFESGNYTGENSALLLKSLGGKYVEIGHAERREIFGETNEQVHKKVRLSIRQGLIPVICVGETAESLERGNNRALLREQVCRSFDGADAGELSSTILVYEPVWAIGRDKPAQAEYVEEVHSYLRDVVCQLFGGASDLLRIIYGGSNSPDTCRDFIRRENIDGLFVGRSALKAENFEKILEVVFEEKCGR